MSRIFRHTLVACALLLPAFALAQPVAKPATAATVAVQQRMLAALPHDDGRDERWARQGFIATLDDPVSRRADGGVAYDPESTKFVDAPEAPPTVNPALWRHQRLLRIHGLFQVSENVYQVRGLSCTNPTFIRGRTGWVVIDPDMTAETAASAMTLVDRHLGKRPISAVIYSHSHVDHLGGVRGVLRDQKEVPVIVGPEHLIEETGAEWVMVGNVMTRRSHFQWGVDLPRDPKGFVGTGLSAEVPMGTINLIPPTDTVLKTGEARVLDGVRVEFQMVPETEAVAEMNIHLPDERVLYIAEFATATMHNLQTPRGAQARDARAWAGYLTEALERYGDGTDAVVFGHTWPRFGNVEVRKFITLQRDNYKYIHDQVLRMANLGMSQHEIAEALRPPKSLAGRGVVDPRLLRRLPAQRARGVQYYIGWWDGIPAHLDPLPPVAQGRGYVALAGGAKRVLAAARQAYARGEYRWAAELANHVVFADAGDKAAKALLADSYEQMGYQAESGNFRNIYLVAAAELRGKPPFRNWLGSPDLINAMSSESFADLLATRLNPAKVDGRRMTVVLDIGDRQESVRMAVNNSVLVGKVGAAGSFAGEQADVRVTATRPQLLGFFLQQLPLEKMQAAGMKVEGDAAVLRLLQDAIERPPVDFAVVTP